MKNPSFHGPNVNTAFQWWRDTWPHFYADAPAHPGAKLPHVAPQIRTAKKIP